MKKNIVICCEEMLDHLTADEDEPRLVLINEDLDVGVDESDNMGEFKRCPWCGATLPFACQEDER